MASAVTLTETDVGLAKCQVALTQLIGDAKETPSSPVVVSPYAQKFWYTSIGKFRFTLGDLPPELQMIYNLMKVDTFGALVLTHSIVQDIDKHKCPDVQYYILQSVKLLCLHAGALALAHKEHR